MFVYADALGAPALTESLTWNMPHESHQIKRGFEGHRVTNMADAPCKNASSIINDEKMEESVNPSSWSAISNHSRSPIKHGNSLVSRWNDDRKSETVTPVRLFGIDLKFPSTLALFENSSLEPVKATNDASEAYFTSTLSSSDSHQKSGITKDFGDPKQDQLNIPTKEVQSRQSNSSRSRTKVDLTYDSFALTYLFDISLLPDVHYRCLEIKFNQL